MEGEQSVTPESFDSLSTLLGSKGIVEDVVEEVEHEEVASTVSEEEEVEQPAPVVAPKPVAPVAKAPEKDKEPESKDEGESEGALTGLLSALGYDGDQKIESLEDLVAVATSITEKHNAALEVYQREDIADVVKYLQAGGHIDDYKAGEHPTFFFKDAQFEDDQTQDAEAFITDILKEKGIVQKVIDLTIQSYKEDGTLISSANEAIGIKRVEEEAANARIIAANQAQVQEQIQKFEEYSKAVIDSFDKPMSGVTAAPALVKAAKLDSTPNAERQVAIYDSFAKFTPQQKAIVQLAIKAVETGQTFSYSPTKKPVASKASDITGALFVKTGAAKEAIEAKEMSREEFFESIKAK